MLKKIFIELSANVRLKEITTAAKFFIGTVLASVAAVAVLYFVSWSCYYAGIPM